MERFAHSVDHDWYKQRLIGMMICVLVLFVVLLVRLIYLQVVTGEDYLRLSMNNTKSFGVSKPSSNLPI